MLRLASPGWRTFEDLLSEALWLDALTREPAIAAPHIVPARSGEYVLPMSNPHVPHVWNASLMTWVPGRSLGHYLTRRNLEKMGALFARLHQHGASWTPPAGFTSRRFEHWLSRGEKNRIVVDRRSAAAPRPPSDRFVGGGAGADGVPVLPLPWRDLLERMHRHVEAAYAAIDRSDLRVIHCDLWHDNIRLHREVLRPLDFEDTVWGFRAHDIAMAMLDLLEDTDEDRYAALLLAFRHGYTACMSWPDDPIEPFQIGRLLWKINWVAGYQPQGLARMVERHLPVFEHYERTGQVVRPPEG